ncbi:MAG: hypothetical protein ACI9ZH_002103 [Paracoccaceae bacterium]|jgi:hypothetical protein
MVFALLRANATAIAITTGGGPRTAEDGRAHSDTLEKTETV